MGVETSNIAGKTHEKVSVFLYIEGYLPKRRDLRKKRAESRPFPVSTAIWCFLTVTFSQELEDRKHAEFDQNMKYPEQKTHRTSSANLVRSKAEALIDTILFINHIPFRYECGLSFGSIVIYLDFTIRHPETGELYYWEHFGCMDDPAYARNMVSKTPIIQMICGDFSVDGQNHE